MTTFDDRERAFETKFAFDAEQEFKAEARRNKALALWAADLLGHRGEAAEAYARTMLHEELKQPGGSAIIDHLASDLSSKVSREDVSAKMAELMRMSQDASTAP